MSNILHCMGRRVAWASDVYSEGVYPEGFVTWPPGVLCAVSTGDIFKMFAVHRATVLRIISLWTSQTPRKSASYLYGVPDRGHELDNVLCLMQPVVSSDSYLV